MIFYRWQMRQHAIGAVSPDREVCPPQIVHLVVTETERIQPSDPLSCETPDTTPVETYAGEGAIATVVACACCLERAQFMIAQLHKAIDQREATIKKLWETSNA